MNDEEYGRSMQRFHRQAITPRLIKDERDPPTPEEMAEASEKAKKWANTPTKKSKDEDLIEEMDLLDATSEAEQKQIALRKERWKKEREEELKNPPKGGSPNSSSTVGWNDPGR